MALTGDERAKMQNLANETVYNAGYQNHAHVSDEGFRVIAHASKDSQTLAEVVELCATYRVTATLYDENDERVGTVAADGAHHLE